MNFGNNYDILKKLTGNLCELKYLVSHQKLQVIKECGRNGQIQQLDSSTVNSWTVHFKIQTELCMESVELRRPQSLFSGTAAKQTRA